VIIEEGDETEADQEENKANLSRTGLVHNANSIDYIDNQTYQPGYSSNASFTKMPL
jgi:hypothetical protein